MFFSRFVDDDVPSSLSIRKATHFSPHNCLSSNRSTYLMIIYLSNLSFIYQSILPCICIHISYIYICINTHIYIYIRIILTYIHRYLLCIYWCLYTPLFVSVCELVGSPYILNLNWQANIQHVTCA